MNKQSPEYIEVWEKIVQDLMNNYFRRTALEQADSILSIIDESGWLSPSDIGERTMTEKKHIGESTELIAQSGTNMALNKVPSSESGELKDLLLTKIDSIWYCDKKEKCTWQRFALHRGWAIGTIPSEYDEWTKWHKKECGGKLIQAVIVDQTQALKSSALIAELRAKIADLEGRLKEMMTSVDYWRDLYTGHLPE